MFNGKKSRRIATMVIAIILVLAMVLPIVISAIV